MKKLIAHATIIQIPLFFVNMPAYRTDTILTFRPETDIVKKKA